MNETSATSQPGMSLLPEGTGTITTIYLVLLALVALIAIAIIVIGVRRKRVRDRACEQVEAHAREAGVAATPAPPPIAPRADPPPATPAHPLRQAHVPTSISVHPASPKPEPSANEPIAAAAPLDASPAAVASAVPTTSSDTARPGDAPVTQLKGLGPKVATRLAELGITTVGQIAALDEDSAQVLDAQLGVFSGRLARDRWIEQARFLAAGDRAGFEAVFGRL